MTQLTYKGHIFFAENDPHYSASVIALLELEGYKVKHIFTPQEIPAIPSLTVFDLAIIDIRLLDNHDEFDESGIDIAHLLPAETPKLLISLYTSSIHSAMQREWFEGKRLPTNTEWFHKEQGGHKLIEKVAELFEEHYPANKALTLYSDLSLTDFIRQIPKFAHQTEPFFVEWAEELNLLLHRLFVRESGLQVGKMQLGHGGAGLMRLEPLYAGHGRREKQFRGASVILKFGDIESISVEYNNYRQYVEPFLTQRATNVVGVKVRSGRLAGIRFRFIGAHNPLSSVEIQDLETAYHTLTAVELQKIFTDLFKTACALWYGSKAEMTEPTPLVETYKSYFKFDQSDQWGEVYDTIETVAGYGSQITLSQDGRAIQIQDGSGSQETLPHPALFADEHANLFPAIKHQCITHGDFNSRNIFIERHGHHYHTWLIDFYRTGNSAALRDAVQLETVIKFHLLESDNLEQRIAFEQDLLTPHHFTNQLAIQRWRDVGPKFAKAIYAIMAVRQMAHWVHGSGDMREYYGGLLINTLKAITLKARPSATLNEHHIRQQHALYSASLLAQKLEQWPTYQL